MTVLMAIQRDLVQAHGANAAIIHQQITWVIEYGIATDTAHRPGWYTGTSEQLAALTGLSESACRRSMAKLIAAGCVEKQKFRTSQGDHTCSYRPSDPTVSASDEIVESRSDEIVESRSDEIVESRSDEIVESTSTPDVEIITSPTPPEEGEQPELFAGADRGATTRAETKQRKATKASAVSGIFDPLWDRYPRCKGRSIGSKPAALRALTKALKQESSAEILARIDFYALARSAYFEIHQVPAPLMNASTFFNGKHEQWDHEWDREDLEYWPPPAGREWGTPRRRSVEEILASAGGG